MKEVISIVIPVYNVAPYLRQCLDSIRNQTYDNFEAILVDDGSTDGSGEICDGYAALDSRFRVVHQENGGLSAARNTGLNLCGGQLLCMVDPDDYLASDYLALLHQALTEEDADVSICDFKQVQRNGTEKRRSWISRVFRGQEIMREYLGGGMYNQVFNKLYRMELVRTFRFPEYRSAMEDAPWQARVMSRARCVARISDASYFYRIREGSITHQRHSALTTQGTLLDAFARADTVLSWLSEQYAAAPDSGRDTLDDCAELALEYACVWIHNLIVRAARLPDPQRLLHEMYRISNGYATLPTSEKRQDAQSRYRRDLLSFVARERTLPALRREYVCFELAHLRFLSVAKAVRHILLPVLIFCLFIT